MSTTRACVVASGLTLLAASLYAPAHHIVLQHYERVPREACAAASLKCWGNGHPWGAPNCTYCDGTGNADLCQRSNGGSCPYTDANLVCGVRILGGTCVGGPVGTCTGGQVTDPPMVCTVPKC
jgi:hypothetical protein